MANRIQLRRGTAAQWTAANPVLADGEPGVEKDTGKQKFGNGVTAWNLLSYASKGDTGAQGAPGVADDASIAAQVTNPASATSAALAGAIDIRRGMPSSRPGSKVYERRTEAYNFTGSSMRAWRAAMATALNGGAPARINCYGDSIVVGYPGDSTDYHKWAWPTKLAASFAAQLGPTGPGLTFLNPGETDSRLLDTPWAAMTAGYGAFGAYTGFKASATGTQRFVPEVDTDGFTVYLYTNGSQAGTVALSVDGGTPTEFVIPTGEGKKLVSFSITAPLGKRTYTIHAISGAVYVMGFEATVSKAKVIVSRIGKGSTQASALTVPNTTDAPAASLNVAVDMTSPALSIIAFGHNEYLQQTPVATFKAEVEKIIVRAKTYGSVILETQVPNGAAPKTIPQSAYDAALYELADQYDCAVLDTAIRWNSYATSTALYAETTHPNTKGYADKAAAFFEVIPHGAAVAAPLDRFSGGGVPTLTTSASGANAALAAGSTDRAGVITFGTTATPAVGDQVTLTFANKLGAIPPVVVTPLNSASADLRPYVGADVWGFVLRTTVAPTASAGAQAYRFSYITVG